MQRILVVDDDDLVRNVIVQMLHKYNYETLAARNGLEGLMLYESFRPDLVICDIRMPEMDGLEFGRRVGDISATVKILYISGYTNYPTNGPTLAKPFNHKQLQEKVNGLLSAQNIALAFLQVQLQHAI